MIKNHIKLIVRSLFQDKFYTGLILIGLALGIAVSLTLSSYVIHEKSFDQHHPDLETLYRINLKVDFDGHTEDWGSVANIAGPKFQEEIPEVEKFARLLHHNFGRTAFVSTG